jgi:hypothetical protein
MASGQVKGALFMVFMVAGMQLFEVLGRRTIQAQ